jgi:hypothetical protein
VRKIAGPLGLGEGRRKLSWIWLTGLQIEDIVDDQLTDSKSRCRAPSAIRSQKHQTFG